MTWTAIFATKLWKVRMLVFSEATWALLPAETKFWPRLCFYRRLWFCPQGGGVSAPNFRGGVSNFRNTVNVRPVRILLECILVLSAKMNNHSNEISFCKSGWENSFVNHLLTHARSSHDYSRYHDLCDTFLCSFDRSSHLLPVLCQNWYTIS